MMNILDNEKNFRISASKAKRWAHMTDNNDHTRVEYEQIAHMAEGVKKSCGVNSRVYMEIAAIKEKSRIVLEYRDANDGFSGDDEMYYLGYAYVKMAQAIVQVVSSYRVAEAYDKACNGELDLQKCA